MITLVRILPTYWGSLKSLTLAWRERGAAVSQTSRSVPI